MENKTTRIVLVQESVASSIIKDVSTFLLFAGLLYFNHAVLSGSLFIDILFIVLVMMFLIGRGSKSTFSGTKSEAIKWLSGIK